MNDPIRSYDDGVRVSDKIASRREWEEFQAQYAAEERARLERAVKPLTTLPAETSREIRLHNFDQENLWSAPLATIQAILNNPTKRESMYWLLFFGNERTRQTAMESTRVFHLYVANLANRTGFKFNDSTRLMLLAQTEYYVGGVETTEENLDVMLDHLLRAEAFGDGEIEHDPSWKIVPVVPVVQPNPNTGSFESLSLLSDEGARQGRNIADDLMFDEARPIIAAWKASLKANFNVTVPDSDIRYMCEWFIANNRDWLNKNSYDAFRIHMVKTGRWSAALLAEEDIRARAVERLDMTDRDVRAIVLHGTREALLNLLQRKDISLV